MSDECGHYFRSLLERFEAADTVPIANDGERVMCPACGVLVAPRNLVDARRHRRWHELIVERRNVFGPILLGPDQIALAERQAVLLLGDSSASIRSRRMAALLFIQCAFSLSVLGRGAQLWWQHGTFEDYVTWFVRRHGCQLVEIAKHRDFVPVLLSYLVQVGRGELPAPEKLYDTICQPA